MPSPRGVFTLLSVDELAAMRASAISQIQSGRRTSLSGGAKSGSKEWPSDPFEILAEVKYAEQKLGIIPARVTKTYGEFVGDAPFPIVANEQV